MKSISKFNKLFCGLSIHRFLSLYGEVKDPGEAIKSPKGEKSWKTDTTQFLIYYKTTGFKTVIVAKEYRNWSIEETTRPRNRPMQTYLPNLWQRTKAIPGEKIIHSINGTGTTRHPCLKSLDKSYTFHKN